MARQVGLSYKETVEALASFLEISIHTLLYLRAIYPPTTFVRRRAHGVPVYQSRHPQVREYVAEIVSLMAKEMTNGNLRRMTLVVKSVETGLPLERFIMDIGYLGGLRLTTGQGPDPGGGGLMKEGWQKEQGIQDAPNADELSLMLRGFLIRLSNLESQLEDNKGETTFAIVVETKDDLEPASNAAANGGPVPWVPALAADTLHPPSQAGDKDDCVARHEPLLHVKAIETGVIDVRLMVQECVAKTAVEQLRPFGR